MHVCRFQQFCFVYHIHMHDMYIAFTLLCFHLIRLLCIIGLYCINLIYCWFLLSKEMEKCVVTVVVTAYYTISLNYILPY